MDWLYHPSIHHPVVTIIIVLVGGILTMLPALIAYGKRHPHRKFILLLNVLFCWELVVWIGLLVWSLGRGDGRSLRERFARYSAWVERRRS